MAMFANVLPLSLNYAQLNKIKKNVGAVVFINWHQWASASINNGITSH